MKKLISCLVACMVVFSLGTVLATEVSGSVDSADNFQPNDNAIYLDDYSQYEDLMNQMDDQAVAKNAYEESVKQDIEDYKTAKRTPVYRAKVVEASEPQVNYSSYGYYGYYYKTNYQPLTIEVIEGPYQGKVFDDFNYILTCDTYGNIKIPAAQKGDIINVVITDEEGTQTAAPASYDAPVVRWQWVVFLLILTGIITLIYAGKQGAKSFVIFALIADLILVVASSAIVGGINIAFLVTVIVLLTALAYAVLKLGNRAEAYVAILTTLVVTFAIALLAFGFDSIARMCGITYEATYLMEYIMPTLTAEEEIVPTVDFHGLSIGIIALLAFVASLVTSCEVVKVYEKHQKSPEALKETAEEMKEPVATKMMFAFMILIVLILPKCLILLTNKYSFAEIINSEILISEGSRVLFTIMAIALSSPIAALLCKFIGDGEEK